MQLQPCRATIFYSELCLCPTERSDRPDVVANMLHIASLCRASKNGVYVQVKVLHVRICSEHQEHQ